MKRQTTTQFFYQNGKLVTVNQGGQHRTIFRSTDIPHAELSTGERQETGLLEVDQNGSVLKVSGDTDEEEPHSYCTYGHDPSLPSQRTIAGFNGESLEAMTAAYLLGNGYRLYSPILMRFHSADSISPFGRGGLNAYAYCNGDPVNNSDPSGHYTAKQLVQIRNKPLTGSRPRKPPEYHNVKFEHERQIKRLAKLKTSLHNTDQKLITTGVYSKKYSALLDTHKSLIQQNDKLDNSFQQLPDPDPTDWADKRRLQKQGANIIAQSQALEKLFDENFVKMRAHERKSGKLLDEMEKLRNGIDELESALNLK